MATKKATDKKQPHHAKSDLFTFTCDAGTIKLPYIENLPRKLMREVAQTVRDGGDPDDVLFGALLDEKDLEVLEEMTVGEYDDLTTRWDEESSISLGE